jgi:LPS-assembly protein
MRKLVFLSAVSLSCIPALSMAQADWHNCHSQQTASFLPEQQTNTDESPTDVKADNAQVTQDGKSVFEGNVEINRAGQRLNAEHVTYDKQTGEIAAKGNVTLKDSRVILQGADAQWSVNSDEGDLNQAEYQIKEMHARGNASHVYRKGTSYTELDNATYTTCAKGDDAWVLAADRVELKHDEAVGEAEDVVLKLAGVPIFYSPYLSFPLNDERKSGFLIPSIGNSDETGADITIPYYWNLAPNMDVTLSPRMMSERGLMLDGEFRYLNKFGQGSIQGALLHSDNLKKNGRNINPHHDEDREHFSWKHQADFASGWYTRLDYNYVSDDEYLEDFGSNLSIASTTHLNRDLQVGFASSNWQLLARAQGFQTITNDVSPYKRLPQLKLQGDVPTNLFGLNIGLTAEYVDFDHETKVTGQRYNIEPSLSLPLQTSYAFLKPRVALQHTRYDLDDNLVAGSEKSPTRTLPIASVDSGLLFEKAFSLNDNEFIQTIEPRAFYLYIPERDQEDIPVFDSTLNTFRVGQLFSHNRFTGIDRIGDANQLSLAVTTRLINAQTGRENLSFTLGQIRYFSDRHVTMPGEATATRSDSDMIADITANIAKNWSVRGELQWNPHGDTSNLSAIQLRYNNHNGTIVNVAHRYRRDDEGTDNGLEQVDISARVPLNKNWSVVGRYYRSLHESRTLEGLAGIEYNSCCWATRFVARNYINNIDDERNVAFFLQLELKGLGNFGQKAETLLSKSIIGYNP